MSCQFCFVIMPFSEEENNGKVFAEGIRPAIESLGIECIRLDQVNFTQKITDAIVERIKGAYFVVADLSSEKPNCYYECGFAHALGKPVILATSDIRSIHFDLRDFPFIIYRSPDELRSKLSRSVMETILTTKPRLHDDPHNGNFGRKAVSGDRLLTATISPAPQYADYECDVVLEVRSLPAGRPFRGQVTFFLHPTFDPDEIRVKVTNGTASTRIEADGAFTVGAESDRGRTRLELDLGTIPGGTDSFYAEVEEQSSWWKIWKQRLDDLRANTIDIFARPVGIEGD
jgi:hypothetical protein